MLFSPSDAAFEGFRLARRRPLTVVALSVVGLVSAFATYWMMDVSGYAQAMTSLNGNPSPDPQAALGLLGPFLRFAAGCAVIACVVSAIQGAAVYRGVLRPQEPGMLGLGFGADEMRLLLLAVLLVLLGTLIFIGVLIVFSIVLGVAGGAAMAAGAGVGPTLALVALLYAALGVLAMWLGTRMSFAGPHTFATRKVDLFASWRLTRENFWGLLGCYVLTVFLAMLIGFIMFVVALIVSSAVTGTPFMQALGEFAGRRGGAPIDLYSPVRVIYTLVSSLFGGLLTMVMTAPAAEAYRQICQGSAQAEAFN